MIKNYLDGVLKWLNKFQTFLGSHLKTILLLLIILRKKMFCLDIMVGKSSFALGIIDTYKSSHDTEDSFRFFNRDYVKETLLLNGKSP